MTKDVCFLHQSAGGVRVLAVGGWGPDMRMVLFCLMISKHRKDKFGARGSTYWTDT